MNFYLNSILKGRTLVCLSEYWEYHMKKESSANREINDLKESLRKSEERFKFVSMATNDTVWDWDLKTNNVWWSEGIVNFLNYQRDDVKGDISWWEEHVHPEDRKRIVDSLKTVIASNGQLWSAEYKFLRADGSYVIVYNRAYVIRDDKDSPVRVIGAMTDISERKKMESRMLRTEKLSAMGQLAAGVAHEINNPLGVILGFSQGAIRRLKSDDPLDYPLKSIEREAVRCKNLVQDLLTFSRSTTTDQGPIDMNQTVMGALSLIRAQSKMSKVELETKLADGLPRVLGSKNQIQQIVINLATNSFDAMPDGGVLTVKTELVNEGIRSWVVLRVEDTGTGMSQEVREKMFEPFFTTKPVGRGTGLGLSLVYEIVKKHSGLINFESQEGHTEFFVKLPARTGDESDQKE